MHWDASALESVTPEAHGQRQRWTLHVGGSFTDVPSTSPGCGGGDYWPGAAVTREQMGVFITGTFGLTLYGM